MDFQLNCLKDKFTFLYKKNKINADLFVGMKNMHFIIFFTLEPVQHFTCDQQIAGAMPGFCRLSVHCLPIPAIRAGSYQIAGRIKELRGRSPAPSQLIENCNFVGRN